MSAPGADESAQSQETAANKSDPTSDELAAASGNAGDPQPGQTRRKGSLNAVANSFKGLFGKAKEKISKGAKVAYEKTASATSAAGGYITKGYKATVEHTSKAGSALMHKISGPRMQPEDDKEFVVLLDQLGRTEKQLQILIHHTTHLIRHQQEYLKIEQSWAANVGKSVSGDAATALYDQKCTEVGTKLLAVAQKKRQTNASLGRLFVEPLNAFLNNEIAHAKKLRVEYDEAKKRFDYQVFATQKIREQAASAAQQQKLEQSERTLHTRREFYTKIKAQYSDIMQIISHKKNSEVKQIIENLKISVTNMHRDSLKILIESAVDRNPDVL